LKSGQINDRILVETVKLLLVFLLFYYLAVLRIYHTILMVLHEI